MNMGTRKLPRLLLIAGTGRNCGKTTFACHIIERFSRVVPLCSLKISSHRSHIPAFPIPHSVIVADDKLWMMEETERNTGKDSSRMLDAGALRSFFAVAGREGMDRIPDLLAGLADENTFWVVESGGLLQVVEPGLFVRIGRDETPDPEQLGAMKEGWKWIG